MKLISVIGAVCVIALGGYWFAFESDYRLTDRQASAENSIEFITVQLERKDLINYDELDGILEYGDPFVVTSLTSGVLTDVAAEGSKVQRGELVYRLYRSVTDSEWLLAEQQHASASASLSQAELALENEHATIAAKCGDRRARAAAGIPVFGAHRQSPGRFDVRRGRQRAGVADPVDR